MAICRVTHGPALAVFPPGWHGAMFPLAIVPASCSLPGKGPIAHGPVSQVLPLAGLSSYCLREHLSLYHGRL